MNPTAQLADLIRHANAAVAFTGAGISTESGISDFRSPGGVWSRFTPVMYDEFLASRAARVRYWQMRNALYRETRNARPNAAHRALAELEQQGRLRGVITQNIDGLHQDAGSRRVLEIHGTNRIVACVACDKRWHPDDVLAMLEAGDDAPDCDDCGHPLKSRTISFGQAMPAGIMAEALERSRTCDLFLALGSSLLVEPAASLPRIAQAAGARLVIINNAATPLDAQADLVMQATLGTALGELIAAFDAGSPR